ncbi:MAG: hypothetical protein RMJ53_05095, partial [Chitinophagales bacterium]|nr:hypothetical protein [Chitinophagales bacterium]
MLGRRHIRIKVLQTYYAKELANDVPLTFLEGQLKTTFHKTLQLYLTMLRYLVDTCLYVLVDKSLRQAKFLKTNEDQSFSTLLASNKIAVSLDENSTLKKLWEKENINQFIDKNIVRELYQSLYKHSSYSIYRMLEHATLEA